MAPIDIDVARSPVLLQTPTHLTDPTGPPVPTPTPPAIDELVVDTSVYAPQSDSCLLVEATLALGDQVGGARVLDLCCGSGIAAVTAARLRAAEVLALDLNPAAVRSAAANAARHAPAMHARRGSLADALAHGPFDVVLCNPPYVPSPRGDVDHSSAESAWDAGHEGRSVLEPLCRALPELLSVGGVALIVQSEVAGIDETVSACQDAGLTASVVSRIRVPLGPVMRSRLDWFVGRGLLPTGADDEELVVIRASR